MVHKMKRNWKPVASVDGAINYVSSHRFSIVRRNRHICKLCLPNKFTLYNLHLQLYSEVHITHAKKWRTAIARGPQ